MKNKQKKFIQLINKYQDEDLSESQKLIIDKWLLSFDEEIKTQIWTQTEKEKLKSKILNEVQTISYRTQKTIPFRKILTVAATIALLLTGSWFFIFNKDTNNQTVELPSRYKNDVPPGGNKAILTLADGATITLDDANKGVIADQGETEVVKLDEGQLSYNISASYTNNAPKSNSPKKEILYNTLATPKGGQYHLILPDGSKVWLNSSSSITYPTLFADNLRSVQVTGEVYFEVTKTTITSQSGQSKRIPFIISANDFEVQVLGTHLNIMAYEDEESFKTTLIEGSIKISKGDESALLEPGQQAIIKPEIDNIQIVENITPENVIAWKNGYFHFDRANTETVLRQLSRWYDVEVVFRHSVPNFKFSGELQKNLNLSQILLILEKSRIAFEIENNKLIVLESED